MSVATSLSRLAFVGMVTGSLAGCALTSKSDSVFLRYFSPVSTAAHTTSATGGASPASPEIVLAMGRINAARHLRDKLAFRDSAYEVGYYDDLRWTDKPEAYLRHALWATLFEERRARQRVAGAGLTLDVDLDAFEEIKAPRHVARVGVTWGLRDEQLVLAQESFVVERPFPANGETDPGALVASLSAALDEAVARIVKDVLAQATRPPTPSP